MTALVEVDGWAGALEKLVAGLASRFYREAGVRRALSYLRGLLAPLERKNGWHLAAAAGDVSPAAMQDFLTRTRWDAEAVRDDLQDYVVEHLGDEKAVLVLDETGFVKKGAHSVGVKRQYLLRCPTGPARPAALRTVRSPCSSATPAIVAGADRPRPLPARGVGRG
jgi:SRSO17 transposase